jgi:hypothetical protein
VSPDKGSSDEHADRGMVRPVAESASAPGRPNRTVRGRLTFFSTFAAPARKRPARAGRLRKQGRPMETWPPDRVTHHSAPGGNRTLSSLGAIRGAGVHRRGLPPLARHSHARGEKRTCCAHRVNSSCRDPHTFTPCPPRARTPLAVTKGGASAPYLSRKGSE